MKRPLLDRLVLFPFLLVLIFLGVVVLQFNRFAIEFEQLAVNQEALAERAAIAVIEYGQRRFEEQIAWLKADEWEVALGRLTHENGYSGAAVLDRFSGEIARRMAEPTTEAIVDAALKRIGRAVLMGDAPAGRPLFEPYEEAMLALYTARSEAAEAGEVWIVAWEVLGADALAARANRLGGQVELEWMVGAEIPEDGSAKDAVVPLRNADGTRVGSLGARATHDSLGATSRFVSRQLWVLSALLILFLVVFTGAIFVGFGLPLARLNHALAEHQPAALTGLARRDHEFGRLADLMLRFFEQEQALRTEVDARERVEASLQASERGLREALVKRERLARDIHDNTIQSVFSLGLRIRKIERSYGSAKERDQMDFKRELADVAEQINRIIADMRNLIAELAPGDIQEQGLKEALERLGESLHGSTGATLELAIPETLCDEMDREAQLNIFHIVHEAFSNALRHGQAKTLACRLSCDEQESLSLEIKDNGAGFDPAAVPPGGRGLVNMRQRAREIGADFEIHSQPGGPTRIHLSGF